MGPLGEVLTQLSKGGGAKGINIEDVTRQLEELTTKYPFQVGSCGWRAVPPSSMDALIRCAVPTGPLTSPAYHCRRSSRRALSR